MYRSSTSSVSTRQTPMSVPVSAQKPSTRGSSRVANEGHPASKHAAATVAAASTKQPPSSAATSSKQPPSSAATSSKQQLSSILVAATPKSNAADRNGSTVGEYEIQSAAASAPESKQQQKEVAAYAAIRYGTIYGHEIGNSFRDILKDLLGGWLYGLRAAVTDYVDEQSANTGASASAKNAVWAKKYKMGLDHVSQWTRDTARMQVAALVKMCKEIRSVYTSVVNLYFKLYFHQYPKVTYQVEVPSLTDFVTTLFAKFSKETAVQNQAIFEFSNLKWTKLVENLISDTLRVICMPAIEKVFQQIQTSGVVPSLAPASKKQQAAAATMTAAHKNEQNKMFQSIVETTLRDVETPAATPADKKSSSSRKTSSSNSTKSVAAAEGERGSRRTVDTHRTVQLKSPAASARGKSLHHQKELPGDDFSDDSRASDDGSYNSDEGSYSESDYTSSSGEEEQQVSRHRHSSSTSSHPPATKGGHHNSRRSSTRR